MESKLNTGDYSKYFIPVDGGVLIDNAIFEHRKTLGNKIWALISLYSGAGSDHDVSEFEHVADDSYLARKNFDAIRGKLFAEVVLRDGEFCQNCGTTNDLTLDHVVPLSRGGPNDIENMQILCRKHNSQKGAR